MFLWFFRTTSLRTRTSKLLASIQNSFTKDCLRISTLSTTSLLFNFHYFIYVLLNLETFCRQPEQKLLPLPPFLQQQLKHLLRHWQSFFFYVNVVYKFNNIFSLDLDPWYQLVVEVHSNLFPP
jgi:hypothetical protein